MAGRIIIDGVNPSLDADGEPISGATLTFYLANSLTLGNIYAAQVGAPPLPNPLTADTAGRFPMIWADFTSVFDVVWKDAGGATIDTFEDVSVFSSGGSFTGVTGISFSPPYTSNRWMTVNPVDTDNPPFYWNASDTANAGSPTRPNYVVNFGHNLGAGGGPVQAGKGLFGQGYEGHYEPNPGEAYWEWHVYAGFVEDGIQRRPYSMRLNKNLANTFGWAHLWDGDLFTYRAPKKATPFMQAQPTGFQWLCFNNAGTGEPERGYVIQAENSDPANPRVVIGAQPGSGTLDLQFATWRDVYWSNGMVLEDDGRFFFNDTVGQGRLGNLAADTVGYIHSANKMNFGKFGGSTAIAIDNANNRVALGTAATSPSYPVHVQGALGLTPGNSVTPVNNGDVVFQLTSNTQLTIKAKGSDGVVRSANIALA